MNKMRRLFFIVGSLGLITLFVLALSTMHIYSILNQPLNLQQERLFDVKSGASVSSVARDLVRDEVVPSALFLRMYARLTDQTGIKAGEYIIEPKDTSVSLLAKLIEGKVIDYQLTLVEGWTFTEALKYIQQQEKIKVELDSDEALQKFLNEIDLSNQHPEGWFFPDTYRYASTSSDKDILTKAHLRMRDTLVTEWANRDVGLPYESYYQALIMASIVEKETGVAFEREQIAGVFIRRLQINMRLQTDPTVIYGLGDKYDGNIRRRHLTEATPYNTYVIKGLPPTPIALPGRGAIVAALHPDDSGNLYFVAKGDGSHQFSETLEQHNQAVQNYQINRRQSQYRSSPQIERSP